MGPIPGLSWADVFGVVVAFAGAASLLGIQWFQADAVAPAGRARRAARITLIALVIPFLVISLYQAWLAPPDSIRVGALILWLGGTVLMRSTAAIREWSSMSRPRPSRSPEPRPNELAQASPANVLVQASVEVGSSQPFGERSPGGRQRLPGFLAVLLLASVAVAPRAVVAVATQTPCERVEVLLAARNLQPVEADPVEWMPPPELPGYRLTLDGPTTLEEVAQGRKNPEESRKELARDGLVTGYERSWDGPNDHLEFAAQGFATSEGALEFHAFANRYACQFANEVFPGPRGAIGLQIRFASGKPIGEQLSWVSGKTRILVFVDHDLPPADHSRVESLVGLIPPR
ncbi:MAG: hypothetical protein Q7S35_05210 [Candidatus Limnocylindrales bacterium]|nr:hypothetical protein [Candidatus Limnocylindrales bacterium]